MVAGSSRWSCVTKLPNRGMHMEDQSDNAEYQEPGKRGRPFEKGNPGRPRGAKNRRSIVAAELLAGEEDALIRRAVELAIEGDVQMLKFLLTRILPRERPVKLGL